MRVPYNFLQENFLQQDTSYSANFKCSSVWRQVDEVDDAVQFMAACGPEADLDIAVRVNLLQELLKQTTTYVGKLDWSKTFISIHFNH